MDEELSQLVRCNLSDAKPPENPIIAPDWAGLAFDRNRYEDLAPAEVWEAWLAIQREVAGDDSVLHVVSMADLRGGQVGVETSATMNCLRKYWEENANFLTDHYVLSIASSSLVRLDQDVTMFAAKADFLRRVVERLGGLGYVMSLMIDDFQPGPDDSTELLRFLGEIVAPL